MAERLSACHLELAVFVPPPNFWEGGSQIPYASVVTGARFQLKHYLQLLAGVSGSFLLGPLWSLARGPGVAVLHALCLVRSLICCFNGAMW